MGIRFKIFLERIKACEVLITEESTIYDHHFLLKILNKI